MLTTPQVTSGLLDSGLTAGATSVCPRACPAGSRHAARPRQTARGGRLAPPRTSQTPSWLSSRHCRRGAPLAPSSPHSLCPTRRICSQHKSLLSLPGWKRSMSPSRPEDKTRVPASGLPTRPLCPAPSAWDKPAFCALSGDPRASRSGPSAWVVRNGPLSPPPSLLSPQAPPFYLTPPPHSSYPCIRFLCHATPPRRLSPRRTRGSSPRALRPALRARHAVGEPPTLASE